jgi:putative spermidine/putrescine transport system substrate-binding protein
MAVGIGLVGTGLMYNTKYFREKGWPAPTSWNDLKDPKYKKLLVIPPINNTYGLHTLVMFARMNGGGEKNIEPGFKAIKDEVNANVLAYEPSPGKMTELFQSGQAVIAVWGSGRVASFAVTGFPVDFVYPNEGAVTLLPAACPVAKPNASPTAQAFIKAMLAPDLQVVLAKEYGYGPVNRHAKVDPKDVPIAPVGERAEKLVNFDWDTINRHRDEWTRRWNREVER